MTLRQTTLDVRPDERVGDALARIRRDASSEAEKGRWFEHLFMATVRDNAEFDVAGIWPWREWPDREKLTGLDGRDHGIDLVAVQTDGTRVAVQCKCYAENAVVGTAMAQPCQCPARSTLIQHENIPATLVDVAEESQSPRHE